MAHVRIGLAVVAAALALGIGCAALKDERVSVDQCPATMANGLVPPGQPASANGYGVGSLWTWLWPDGRVRFKPGGPGSIGADGSLSMKWPWYRGVSGKLEVSGRRIDGTAPPLRAIVSDAYGDIGFQPTDVMFPVEGCWEVTGRVGEASLTFITLVTRE